MANKIGIVLALDGEKEFSQGLKTASSAAKEAKSKLKELDTQYSGSANSIEALRAKQEALTEAQQKYTDKVNAAQSGLDHANTTLEKSKTRYSELQKEVENARKALQEMESAGKSGSSEYEAQAAQVEKLERALSDQGNECSRAQQKVSEYGAKLNTAQSELNEMNNAVSKNDQYLAEAEASADGCATSIDQYGNEVQQATTVTTTWGDKLKQAFANAAVTVGMRALREGVRELVKAFKEMVEVGSEFEASMSYVSAISGATGSDLDALTQKAQELGSSTKFTASEVSDAFGYMALAGWDTEQMLDGISGVLDLAAASGMELADASDMITDYLTAFSMEASDATRVADMLSFAQANSNTTAEQLGEAYGNCAASLNAAGQDIETVTAMLEAMANQGEKGSTAGTALNAVMRDISNHMKDGAIAIGDTTVAVADQEGNFRDLTDIIADVEAATDGMGTAQRRTALSSTFTSRSISGLSLLLNEGADSIAGYEEALRNADGAASDMADTMQDNLEGDMTRMNSALQGLSIAVYDYFNEPLRDAVQGITSILSGVTEALTPQQTIITQQASSVKEMVDDIKSANDDLNSVMESTQSAMDDAIESSEKITLLGTQLESLNGIEDKTVTQKDRMRDIVDQLSGSIPALAAAFDEEKDKVLMTNDAIEKLVQSSADLEKVNIWTEALSDEYKALADAELAYTKASTNSEKLQGEADLWTSLTQTIGDYQVSLSSGVIRTEEDAASAAEGLAEIQGMLDDAFLNGVISEEEYQGALDALSEATNENGISYYEAASNLGSYSSDLMGVYTPAAEEAAEETAELKDNLDESQASVEASEKALEGLTEAQQQEAVAADAAVIKSQTVVNMMDELGDSVDDASEKNLALAESDNALADTMEQGVQAANGYLGAVTGLSDGTDKLIVSEEKAADAAQYYYDSNEEIIGSLDELKESTISAADAEEEIYDETGECIGTMGDYAAAIEEASDETEELGEESKKTLADMQELRASADEVAEALETSYSDAFNTVMDLYDSTKESFAQGLDIDFRTSFNGGADETVEAMLQTSQENIEALQNYANNLEIVKDHVGQEIAPEFLAYLEELGTDGANTLQHIANTFEQDNGSELITQWSDNYLETLSIEDQIAETLTMDQLFLQNGLDTLGSTEAEWTGLQESLDASKELLSEYGANLPQDIYDSFEGVMQAAQDAGITIPEGLAEGLSGGTYKAEEAIDILNQAMQGQFDALVELAEENGIEVPSALSEGVEQGGQTAADAINTLIDTMTESLANGSGDISDAADSAVEEGVDGAGEGAGDGIGADIDESIASDVEANAGAIEEAAEGATEQAGAGVEEGAEAITEAAESAADQALEAVTGKEDEFVSAGEEIGESIAEGLENSAKAMTSAVESALNEVAAAADTIDLSGFEAVGERAGEEFGNGIIASDASAAASEMANGALETLDQSAENFTSKGTTSGQNYSTALGEEAGEASSQSRVLSTGALDTLDQTEANYTTKGSESGTNYATGISSQSGAASSAGNTIAQAAISSLATASGNFTTQGVSSGSNFANGISSQAGAASAAAAACANAAVGAVQGYSGSFYSVGVSMMSGLAGGISAGGSSAINAAVNVAVSALNAAKAEIGSHSPSTRFRDELGYMMSEGTAIGIENGAKDVQAASVEMAEAALTAAEDDLEISSPSKKFRKKVGEMISKGTADGIISKKNLAEDAADSLSNSVYKYATAWLKKYKKSHDTSVQDEKYYWKQIAKCCKEGTAAYSAAIANLAKVSTSKFTDNGDKKDVQTYYSDIYSYADDYLKKRETLNSWSLKEELNYWEQVQKTLKKGTDAWYDAQEQINSIAGSMGSIDNDTLSRAETTLDHIKILNDVSTEEEISYWETLRSSLTKYSDAWYEVTEKINDLKEESYDNIIDAASDYVSKQEALDQMSVSEQLAYWEQIQKEVKKGSDAWYDAQNKINSIKSKIGTVSNMNSLLSAYTTYYDVSAKAEMQYWDTVRQQYTEGTEERLEADQKYFEAKEEYTEKLKDLEDDYLSKVEDVNKQLESDIKSLTDTYNSQLESRISELKNAYSLFDEFTSQSVTGQELLFNIQTQAAGYEAWSDALDTLEERGILSDELLTELTDMGPEEIAAIYALIDLTDEELEAYQEAFDRKMNAIQKQAEEDTADLLEETERQTAELKAQAEKDIAELTAAYDADVASVNQTISSELKLLANNTKSIAEDQTAEIVNAINGGMSSLQSYFSSVNKSSSAAASAASSTASSATSSGSSSTSSSTPSEISKILEIINSGTYISSLTAKQRANHSELTCYLVDNYQRALTANQGKKLGKALGVDVDSSGWKGRTLTALKKKGFATGGKVEDEFAWMDEELDSIGPEMVVSRSDNALLTRLPKGSEIIDANSTDNLLRLAKMDPDSLVSVVAKQQDAIMEAVSGMSDGSELNNMAKATIGQMGPSFSTARMEDLLDEMEDLLEEYMPMIGEPREIGFNKDQMVEQLSDGMSENFAMRSRRRRA